MSDKLSTILSNKTFPHQDALEFCKEYWNDIKIYEYQKGNKNGKNYVIDSPPPTVSGDLHIGHIFSYSHIDFIARFKRMTGHNVLFPMGFDNNGLPTERLTEKIIKKKASSLTHKEFSDHCLDISNEFFSKFHDIFLQMGFSIDWQSQYSTASNNVIATSQASFLDLYNKGIIYRADKKPILWDIIDQTAIADAEIVEQEKETVMYQISIACKDSNDAINIATTRPELLVSCAAILYHPSDERYAHLKNKKAILPIYQLEVPLIPDDKVKPDKGTGLVMTCSFGDELDVYWFNKHQLKVNLAISKYGKLLKTVNNIDSKLDGLKIKDARTEIVRLLTEDNKIIQSDNITHTVKTAERSGAILELLPTPQWFLKITDFKDVLTQQVEKIVWYPEYPKQRILKWIENLNSDWCISRQRYFGVPVPVWYSKEKNEVITPDLTKLPVFPRTEKPDNYPGDDYIPDNDVMDTWATSALTSLLNYKFTTTENNQEQNIDFENYFNDIPPVDLRSQAHDIIRSWAFYSIVKSYHHSDNIPWKNIMISGWCLASNKEKMSKSKGNTILPGKLIKEYGVDTIRLWASSTKLGNDITFSQSYLDIAKKLINKLWNSAKFVHIHIKECNLNSSYQEKICEASDFWIINELNIIIEQAKIALEKFDYYHARNIIEEFFWNKFCDNYIELVKSRIYQNPQYNWTDQQRQYESAIYTLHYVMLTVLKLFSPFIPYTTEIIFLTIFKNENNHQDSLHKMGNWPEQFINSYTDQLHNGRLIIKILEDVRKSKSENNVSIKKEIKKLTIHSNKSQILEPYIEDLRNTISAIECKVSTPANQEEDLSLVIDY